MLKQLPLLRSARVLFLMLPQFGIRLAYDIDQSLNFLDLVGIVLVHQSRLGSTRIPSGGRRQLNFAVLGEDRYFLGVLAAPRLVLLPIL